MIRTVVNALACAVVMSGAAYRPVVAQIGAQVIQGVVRDTTIRQPVAGAVVLLLDSTGRTVTRNISDQSGRYRIETEPTARKIRFLRIGYRPRELAIPSSSGTAIEVDVAMTALPTMLETMQVTSGASCSRRDDRLTALSLLDQARAGLLATVVARETKPADMVRVRYVGRIEQNSGTPFTPLVRVDSSSDLKASFQAVRSAAAFVTSGFLDTTGRADVLYGPDAETLLDDAFSDGYCFELRKRDSKRPHSVGLGFTPAKPKSGRIDIDGTLWIDTVARRLEQIQFAYVGLAPALQRMGLGGEIRFAEVGNGIVLIDRWALRIPTAVVDTASVGGPRAAPIVRNLIAVQESGGAVAAARWPEGFTWATPLGSAHVRVVGDDGKLLTGSIVTVDHTDYRATTDDAGIAHLRRMLPGIYEGMITEPVLPAIGIHLTAPLTFAIKHEDSTNVTVKAPSAATYVQGACKNERVPLPIDRDGGWFMARVIDLDNRPIKYAQWRATRSVNGRWVPIKGAEGETSSAGLLEYCGGDVHPGDEVRIESRWSLEDPWHPVTLRLSGHATAVLMKLPLRDGLQ